MVVFVPQLLPTASVTVVGSTGKGGGLIGNVARHGCSSRSTRDRYFTVYDQGSDQSEAH